MKSADLHGMLRARYSAVSPGNGPRYVLAPEVRNAAGFSATRSCDLIVADTWESGPARLIGHELKVSRSDWLRELKAPEKAQAFIRHVAEWWLVIGDRKIVRDGELPEGWGLLAPAGENLRAVVKPSKVKQPPVPTGLLVAMMRSVHSAGKGELARERGRPFDAATVPMMRTSDYIAEHEGSFLPVKPSEIQKPRYDLRTRR